MTAQIIMFVPRPNPKRDEEIAMTYEAMCRHSGYSFGGLQNGEPIFGPTDCGNLGWPWSEDKA
jgi:hypothetical protein